TIGELFLPGIVFPGIFFGILLFWPFIEAAVTKDRLHHNFLDRPRDAPLRSAVGAAGLALMAVLTLAGGNDVLATFLNIEVDRLNVFLKIAAFAAPLVAGVVTWRICRDLKRYDLHPVQLPDHGTLTRTGEGGFEPAAPERDEGPPGDA